MRIFHPIRLALGFLTRIPLPMPEDPTEKEWGQSVFYYPLVGAVIAGLLLLVYWLADSQTIFVQGALILVVWVMVTGAIHLDGLADMADGWAGGHKESKRTLDIMHDPVSGPFGVISLILILMVKFAAILSLLQMEFWWVLLVAPIAGRVTMGVIMATTHYARDEGIGQVLSENMHKKAFLVQALLLIAVCYWVPFGFWAVGVVIVLGIYFRMRIIKKIGGFTGDTAGASCELAEALTMTVFALII